jgi:hypothetical protein
VRLIVLLITTIALLGGSCTSADAPRSDTPVPPQLKQTKSLPAALATARRGGSVSDFRLPAFAVHSVAVLEARRGAIAEQDAVVWRGDRWIRPANVTARGPPRG